MRLFIILFVFLSLQSIPIAADAASFFLRRPIVGGAILRLQALSMKGRPPACPFDARASVDEIEETATDEQIDDTISLVEGVFGGHIIRPYEPQRRWLWRQWAGTVVQHSLIITFINMCLSLLVVVCLRAITARSGSILAIGLKPDDSHPLIARLAIFDKVWQYQMNLTTFVLTFFVGEAYKFWRDMYDIGRGIQGRLNDINLLVASHAARDKEGKYTPEARELLDDVGQFSRVFHALLWASVSRRYRALLTNRGLSRMVNRGMLTSRQKEVLQNLDLPPTQKHSACLEWIIIRVRQGVEKGILKDPEGFFRTLLQKVCDLRGTFASIDDKVDGRMPLAYAHFVQVLVDSFIFCAPLALYAELGAFSVLSVGMLTLFYSGFLDLGKVLLDPLDNEDYCQASIYMDLGVFIRESNAASTRWRNGAESLPF